MSIGQLPKGVALPPRWAPTVDAMGATACEDIGFVDLTPTFVYEWWMLRCAVMR